jgi:hypothetical protein
MLGVLLETERLRAVLFCAVLAFSLTATGRAQIYTASLTGVVSDPNTGVVRVLHTPNVEAVQEFKLEQANFRADIGFASAAALNIVSRSATFGLVTCQRNSPRQVQLGAKLYW